jgi:hypothetical protein
VTIMNPAVRCLFFGSCFLLAIARVSAEVADTWHWRNPLPQGNHIFGITYGNGRFVAVGNEGSILQSTDGVHWLARSLAEDVHPNAIAYGQGRYVAVGQPVIRYPDTLLSAALSSQNSTNWSIHYLQTSNAYMNAVAYGDGIFVAVGHYGLGGLRPLILTSVDGATWINQDIPLTNSLSSIAYGNNRFVAVGYAQYNNYAFGPAILTSPDGANWTAQEGETNSSLNAITFGDGRFVAVGPVYSNAGPMGQRLFQPTA